VIMPDKDKAGDNVTDVNGTQVMIAATIPNKVAYNERP
jgi:hypothetical protein